MSITKGLLDGINYVDYIKDTNKGTQTVPPGEDKTAPAKDFGVKELEKSNSTGGFEDMEGDSAEDAPSKLRQKEAVKNSTDKSNINNGVDILTSKDGEASAGQDSMVKEGVSIIKRGKNQKRRAFAGLAALRMAKSKGDARYEKYKRLRARAMALKAKMKTKYGRKGLSAARKAIR